APHRGVHAASLVPELVPAALSLRLRRIPAGRRVERPLLATLAGEGRALAREEFIADVRAGLGRPGQKTLPSKYLYDDVGSALFEAISRLPEYGLTRADERLLRRYASDIVDRVASPAA